MGFTVTMISPKELIKNSEMPTSSLLFDAPQSESRKGNAHTLERPNAHTCT